MTSRGVALIARACKRIYAQTMKKQLAVLAVFILGTTFLIPTGGHAAEWNGVRITPYAGVSGTYDDNITFQSEETLDDFITSLNAGLKAHYETHLSTFELAGVLHYNAFASNEEFNNFSGDLSADWKQELSPYDRIQVSDVYVHSDEPVSFADAFNTRAGRFTYQTNTVKLNYEHDFSSRWTGRARYSNEFTLTSDVLREESVMNTAGAGTVYRAGQALQLSVDYDYQARGFENGRDASAHSFMTGARYNFTDVLYAEAKVGVDAIDPYVGADLNEPRFGAKLTGEINQTTTAIVAFEKGHSLNSYVEDVFDHWQVSGALKKQWSDRLESTLTVFYGEGQYIASLVEDELLGAKLAFSYDLTENWEATARYGFTSVSSSVAAQEYEKNIVSVGLTCNF